jgi:hypothetical protein
MSTTTPENFKVGLPARLLMMLEHPPQRIPAVIAFSRSLSPITGFSRAEGTHDIQSHRAQRAIPSKPAKIQKFPLSAKFLLRTAPDFPSL